MVAPDFYAFTCYIFFSEEVWQEKERSREHNGHRRTQLQKTLFDMIALYGIFDKFTTLFSHILSTFQLYKIIQSNLAFSSLFCLNHWAFPRILAFSLLNYSGLLSRTLNYFWKKNASRSSDIDPDYAWDNRNIMKVIIEPNHAKCHARYAKVAKSKNDQICLHYSQVYKWLNTISCQANT